LAPAVRSAAPIRQELLDGKRSVFHPSFVVKLLVTPVFRLVAFIDIKKSAVVRLLDNNRAAVRLIDKDGVVVALLFDDAERNTDAASRAVGEVRAVFHDPESDELAEVLFIRKVAMTVIIG